jgi:3-oxoacyl-[acyl-carrier protein] reductase
MGQLSGRTAVVTGASKGIGAAIAKALAEAGASVVVNYASSRGDAERIVGAIEEMGGKAIAVQGDVARSGDIERLFKVTKDTFGSLDILVNNAGVYRFAPLEEATEDEFHREFNTNVLGMILATQEALKYFGNDGGRVINVSSVASESPVANSVVYSATKGAVDAITRVLAKELGPRKILVNTIAPGLIETEGTHELGVIGSDFEHETVAATPLGRKGQPDDVARVAVFLASGDAGWLTGERFSVAGGYR